MAAIRIKNNIGMEFVYIKPGTFMMGSPENELGRFDSETCHPVTLTKGFYMQTTTVTQGQWKAVMGNNPSFHNNSKPHYKNEAYRGPKNHDEELVRQLNRRFNRVRMHIVWSPYVDLSGCGDDNPVERVSWYDTQEFIQKLNSMEETDKYRLPTEAEWEYACKAGTQTPFSFGECLSSDQANIRGVIPYGNCPKGIKRETTMPVKSFPPNPWGLFDMHGNIFEFCQDWWTGEDYPSGSVKDPIGSVTGTYKVTRGGAFWLSARHCRSACPGWPLKPDRRDGSFGFRIVRTF